MNFVEYQPNTIHLPNHFLRDYVCYDHSGEKIPKEENAQYDRSTFFHDVFFSWDKKYIWAIGAPLYSLEKKLLPFQIFWKKQKIPAKFYINEYSIVCKINAESVISTHPVLIFQNRHFSLTVTIKPFKLINTHSSLVLSVIQKNQPPENILSWILWHHRLYNFKRVLIYDNNSQNKKEVISKLKNTLEKTLEVIFIHWNYPFKHPLTPLPAFCQMAQLNHTLKLHYNQRILIANLDIDEFLIKHRKNFPKKIDILLPVYDLPFIVGKNKKSDKTIEKFFIRRKTYKSYKFFYYPPKIAYISNLHNIYYKNQKKYQNKTSFIKYKYSRVFQKIRKIFLLIFHQFFTPRIYVVHAHCLKTLWKTKDYQAFHQNYNRFLHIKDQNIIELAKKAGLPKV